MHGKTGWKTPAGILIAVSILTYCFWGGIGPVIRRPDMAVDNTLTKAQDWGLIGRLCGFGSVIVHHTHAQLQSKESPASRNVLTNGVVGMVVWGNLIDPEVLQDFSKETGIRVVTTKVESNEDIFKILDTETNWDVALPSRYALKMLAGDGKLKLLAELNLPVKRFPQPPPFAASQWGSESAYGIFYLWASYGIVYNSTYLSDPLQTWKSLLDPAARSLQLKQQLGTNIALLDEQRYAMAAALVSLGFDANATNTDQIRSAKELLKRFRTGSAGFIARDQVVQQLLTRKLLVAQASSAQASRALAANSELAFALPKEGTPWITRNLVVPKSSQHLREAESLITFLLQPDIIARIVNYSYYGCADEEARELVDSKVLNSPTFWPVEEHRPYVTHDLSPATQAIYDEIWQEIKGDKPGVIH